MADQPPIDQNRPAAPLPDRPPDVTPAVSAGVDLSAQGDVTIGGDVVGRDKITEIVAGDKIIEKQYAETVAGYGDRAGAKPLYEEAQKYTIRAASIK